jgi:hypothetical protein
LEQQDQYETSPDAIGSQYDRLNPHHSTKIAVSVFEPLFTVIKQHKTNAHQA